MEANNMNNEVKNQSNVGRGGKNKKSAIIILLVLLVLVSGGIFLFLNNKDTSNSGDNDNSVSSSKSTKQNKELYIISKKETLQNELTQYDYNSIYNSDKKTEKMNQYSILEKFDMKWGIGNTLYTVALPTVPFSFIDNHYLLEDLYYKKNTSIQTDNDRTRIFNMTYKIIPSKLSKELVNPLFEHTIDEYSKNFFAKHDIGYSDTEKLGIYTEIKQKNNVMGYACYLHTTASSRKIVRVYYFVDLGNNVSTDEFTLATDLYFYVNDYESVKPTLEELSKTLDFNLLELTDEIIK